MFRNTARRTKNRRPSRNRRSNLRSSYARMLRAEHLEERQLLTAVTWYLDDVTFDTGEVASGSFKYDADLVEGRLGAFTDIDIQVTRDGTTQDYNIVNPISAGNATYIGLVAATGGDLTGKGALAFTLGAAMTNSGGVIDILPGPANLSYQGFCASADCTGNFGPYDEVISGRIYAGPRTWHLDNVRLDDGRLAEGSFTYDADSGAFSNIGVALAGESTFRWDNPGLESTETNIRLVNGTGDLTGDQNLSLALASQLTNAAGVVDILPGPLDSSNMGVCSTASCDTVAAPFSQVASGSLRSSIDAEQTWYLENVRFDTGETATGSFTYNHFPYNPALGQYGTFTNINIDATRAGAVNEYRIVNPGSRGNQRYVSVVAATGGDLTGKGFLALTPASPMVPGQDQIAILPGPQNLSYQGVCVRADCGPAGGPYDEVIAGGRLVRELVAPTLTSLPMVVVADNQTLAYDASAADNLDTEGNGLTYSLTGGTDMSLFNIDSATGVVTFQTAPDFNAPGDTNGDNVYEIELTVTDLGGLTEAQNIAIRVTDGTPTDWSLTVEIAADESDGDYSAGDLSLREAIELANMDANITGIRFDGSVFNGEAADVIRLNNQQLPSITDSLHIDGGTQNVVISADRRGNDRVVPGTFITDIAASDAEARTLDDNVGRVLEITAPAGDTITLTGLTITGGDVDGWGGGIINNSADLVIINSSIAGNRATNRGGGVRTNDGSLTLTGTTVSGNFNTGNSHGGGIEVGGGSLSLSSSTVSSNQTNGHWGGGIYSSSGSVAIDNSTIVQNASASSGGGIVTFGATTFNNSIIAGNSTVSGIAPDLAGLGNGMNFSGSYNLIGYGNSFASGTGNQWSTTFASAGLGTLANNGGPTLTHALLTNSPAINAADPNYVPGPSSADFFDQRGSSNWRIRDGRMDIGAVESNGVANFIGDVLIQRQTADPTLVEVSIAGATVATTPPGQNINFVVTSLPGNDLTLTVDYTNGYFDSDGISFAANAGDSDMLKVVGDATPRMTRATMTATSGTGSVQTAYGISSSTIAFSDVASFDFDNLLSFASDQFLSIDNGQSVAVDALGFSTLGGATILADGSALNVAGGVSLRSGDMLLAAGYFDNPVAAGIGSTIQATGELGLGDPNSVNGFFSDGVLHTGLDTVALYDANEVVLGSLTTLGDGTTGGRLVAGTATGNMTTDNASLPEDLLLEDGKNVTGRGMIRGNFRNMGSVIGDANTAGQRIVFEDGFTVTGIGFAQNVIYNGTFSPGLSPGIARGENLAFAGNVQIELGGTTPGTGNSHHDQISDAGQITLIDGASLKVAPWNGFQPTVGDEFEILVAHGGINGTFDQVTVDSAFTDAGIDFQLQYSSNGLTLAAVEAGAAGDFDTDGDVDGADFLAWQRGFSTTYDANDLTDWQTSYGQTPAVAPVEGAPAPLHAAAISDTEGPATDSVDTSLADLASAWQLVNQPEDVVPHAVDETVAMDKVFGKLGFSDYDLPHSPATVSGDFLVSAEDKATFDEDFWLSEELLEKVFA